MLSLKEDSARTFQREGLSDDRFDSTDWGDAIHLGFFLHSCSGGSLFVNPKPEELQVRDYLYRSRFGARIRMAHDVGWVIEPWGVGQVQGWTSYSPDDGRSKQHPTPSLSDAMDAAGVPDYLNDPAAFAKVERTLWRLNLWDAYKAKLDERTQGRAPALLDKVEAADAAIRAGRETFCGEVWPICFDGPPPAPPAQIRVPPG